MAVSLALAASAQQTATTTPSSSSTSSNEDVLKMEKFVVEGALAGRAKALEIQQESPNLVNVVSSDNIGTLPDFNAAEAAARLPAVALITDQGEGRFISIRGAKPNYNGTLINGFTMPAGDRSERRVDLQTVSNALVERIEITKAATPDQPAEGIGGMTNLIFRNPAEIQGRTGGISAYWGVNDYDGHDYRAEVSYADYLGSSDNLAITLSGNYRKGDRNYYTAEASWGQVKGQNGSTIWAPNDIEYGYQNLERYNQGGSIGLGYKMNDHTKFQAQLYYSHFWAPEYQHGFEIEFEPTTNSSGNATNWNSSGGTIDGEGSRGWAYQEWHLTNYGVQLTGETKLASDLKLDGGLAVQRALEEYPFDLDYASGGYSFSGLTASVSPEMIILAPGAPTNPLFNAANYPIIRWNSTIARKDAEKERVAFINGTKDFDLASGSKFQLKGGFYGRFRNKTAERSLYRRFPGAGSTLTFENLTTGETLNNFNGTGAIFGDVVNNKVAEGFLSQHNADFPTTTTIFTQGLDASDYFANEDILAGYAMGNYTVGNLEVLGGVRYEKTKEKLTRLANDNSIVVIRDDFNHTMPSVHMKYTFRPGLFARASWSNTVGRHDTGDLIYGGVNINRTNRTITVPNPALKSLESENIDASIEWYMGKLGWLMAGYFSKDIKNYPLQTQEQITFEGQPYTRFTVQAGANAEIRGWEAAFQRKFDFLPDPFSGLGVDINYASIDSELSASIRPDRPPLEQQPDSVFNASVFYAYKKLYVRLAYFKTGESIDRGGTSGSGPEEDYIRADYDRWDLTGSYNLTENVQLYGEWRNITDEPELVYVGNASQLGAIGYYGWFSSFGVRWHF